MMQFTSRESAKRLLEEALKGHCECCSHKASLLRFDRWRNYEIEDALEQRLGGSWCVTDWCPFNGRYCKVAHYVPLPHPPLKGQEPHAPETAIPWNEWDPSMTVVLDDAQATGTAQADT